MSRIISLILSMLLCANIFAQKDSVKRSNTVFIELGGAGGSYSFNYDRLIPLNSKLALNLGVGISPQLLFGFTDFTLMPTYLTSLKLLFVIRERKSLLFGLNNSVFYGNDVIGFYRTYYTSLNCYLGYKYDFKNNKYYFTTSFSPWINYANSLVFFPWLSFSYGYKFNKIERRKIYPKEDIAKIESLSSSLGIVNYKFRLQYEKGHKSNSSN